MRDYIYTQPIDGGQSESQNPDDEPTLLDEDITFDFFDLTNDYCLFGLLTLLILAGILLFTLVTLLTSYAYLY